MEKIGQNPKIGKLWRPAAPQTYVVQKSWPHLRNSLALGLLRGVNSISLQCIPWNLQPPLSEVSVWPTFDFRFWGQMTPKVKIFENVFPNLSTGHQNTFRGQSWWKSAVAKLPKSRVDYHTKNLGSAGLVPTPILPKMGRARPEFPERCHPSTCPRIPNLVRIGCVLPDLFRKDWFFRLKKSIQ